METNDLLLNLGGKSFVTATSEDDPQKWWAPKAPDHLVQVLTWAKSWMAQIILLGVLQTGMHLYRYTLQKAFLDWHWS